MREDEFLQAILASAQEADIPFSLEQARMCRDHLHLMLQWNQRLNLTRITDLNEILTKHILDSLIPSRWLPEAGLALDVGTGPGFPGIPLKILHPELYMVLLEANRKKVSFLKVVLSALRVENICAVQGRWEEFGRMGLPFAAGEFDLVTLRAVRLTREHLQLLAPQVLKPGGILAWWAGPGNGDDETEQHPSSFLEAENMSFDATYHYELPSASGKRRLLVWRKTG